MHSIGENLSQEEVMEMFREADVDRDGKITYEDLIAMVKPPNPQRRNSLSRQISLGSTAST